MALSGRKKPSRRQRKLASIGRDRPRVKPEEAVAYASRRRGDMDPAGRDTAGSTDRPEPATAAQSQPLGDLTYVPRDIRRIATLATVIFVLLGVAAVVLR